MTAIQSAHAEVDAGRRLGALPRLWTSFGYDELNWTYTPRGRRALAAFAAFAERPYYVRAHNLLTSGRGFSWPHWGSGNVYHEDAAGNPVYDWTTVDLVFDAYREAGFRPIVELGFTPQALVPADAALPFTRSPSQYGPYEAGLWGFPPRDNARWQELMYQLARHCVARYGAEEVASWYWEVWNEPDIAYWRGTPEQYYALYDHTVAGLTRALPAIKVGRAGRHRGRERAALSGGVPGALRGSGRARDQRRHRPARRPPGLHLLPHQGLGVWPALWPPLRRRCAAGLGRRRRRGTGGGAPAVAVAAQDADGDPRPPAGRRPVPAAPPPPRAGGRV